MRKFEPVAIVGRSCVLPGALSPEALFDAVREARVLIGEAPDGAWGLDSRRLVRETSPGPDAEYVVSNHGGYVTGFDEVFDASTFADRIDHPERLGRISRWLLHCAQTALGEAGIKTPPAGSGLVVGNLSYPTAEHSRFVEDFWLGEGENAPRPGRLGVTSDARNRFSSGYPAQTVAQAFGLTGDVLALDAACASSLYALEIACRRLQDHESDLMLAGGVACADPLFIHLGFTALQALSPSGQSRPLHKGADGLLPAEGAGLVALKRLDDAVRDGNRIYGVIRGIGLSNDGRQSGFLAPATDGQVRAMESAYQQAGLTPQDIGFIECHATGTARGDKVELESLAQVWGDASKPPIGSIKGNIGHPITASGIASLLKMLSAFDAKLLPPTPCDEPLEEIATYGFRLLDTAEPWECEGPRRAAISNFGFGGNNAHLIVEEWTGETPQRTVTETGAATPSVREPIAITALGVIAGESIGLPAFVRRLTDPRSANKASRRTEDIALPMSGLGFPPTDLKESLAQQTSILAVVDEALGQIDQVNPDRTGVYIGMGVDPQVSRHGLRVRMQELISKDHDIEGWRAANQLAARHLTAAGVIGCMPNIPANRVHAQRDWRAPGFTVASEELSGVDALKIAVRALQAGDIDAAVVGASDFSHELAHRGAAAAVLPEDRQRPGDAAVAMILMRESDARSNDCPILASLVETLPTSEQGAVELTLRPSSGESEVTARLGHAHSASGLLHVAAGVITSHLGVELDSEGAWPAPRQRDTVHTRVTVASFSGIESSVDFASPANTVGAISPVDAPACSFYAADSRKALAARLAANEPTPTGRVRVALVAKSESDLESLRQHAQVELSNGRAPKGPGLYFGEGKPDGEMAFCYTGAAAAYPGASRDLLLAFPKIGQNLTNRFAGAPKLAADLYAANITSFSPATQLTGSSFVCQVHTEFTRHILGMKPQVAMGLSSGETNSLMAFGVWNDLDAMVGEIEASEMYTNQLTGECHAAAKFWKLPKGETPHWKNYRIAAPLQVIEDAVVDEPRVYVTVIQHDEDVVIGGDAEGCARVLAKVGRRKAIDLGLDMVVHCAPLEPFEQIWHAIHERDTFAVPDIRFYTNAGNRAYVPTRDAAADAITQQAIDPIDFPKTVERAYEDGVRVFVEHGPRAILTGAIGRILKGRPHTVVALDPYEGAGLEPLAKSVFRLWALGVPLDLTEFADRLAALRAGAVPAQQPEGRVLRLPVHAPDVQWPTPSTTQLPTTSLTTPISQAGTIMDDKTLAPMGDTMAPPPAQGADAFGYDVGASFSGGIAASEGVPQPSAAQPVAALGDAPARTSNGGGGTVTEHPAVHLFNSVAQAHADFLRQQKETHDAFLALALQDSLGQGGSPAQLAQPQSIVAPPSVAAPQVAPAVAAAPVAAPPVVASPAVHAPAPIATVVTPPAAAQPATSSATSEDATPAAPPIDRSKMPATPFLTREQMEIHAGGKISEIFGELFEKQDGFERQVRMPEPPLLFADRALTIEGEPGSMKKGRVVTETDVKPGEWYLHTNRMAPGVVIESGQADLLLISWLGADFHNQGDRVYRLLGCDLTFYGGLPAAGETLTYDIHVDGHAKTGDVRLFFFHYDCYIGDRRLISVRNGQAGFFSDEELAGSGGVLWDAAEDAPKPDARLDPPPCLTTKRSFSREDVQHFVGGDAYRCFGKGFELAGSHTRTPNTPGGRLQLFDHVPAFEPNGGPWGRGYLRAEAVVPADAWFYKGHFKNDSCMPGTLMADAATQALSFAMAAMGFTLRRDGWRFEPMPGEMARFLCRGQVIPDGPHTLEYEVFIEEIIDGDLPEVYASLLCTSDGFKVFQCRRFGMRLVPDYPLTTKREHLVGAEPKRLVGPGDSDVRGDYEALLACAWGTPSQAFGDMFAKFDGPRKCPRLPGPPYHFMDSIVSVDVAPSSAASSGTLISTFDIDPQAWYIDEGQGHMPFAILVEVLLQPCGWFSCYLNFFADMVGDVAFRNLDGDDCILHRPVTPDMGTLKLTTRLTRFAKAAGTSIVFFDVTCEDQDGPLMTLKTAFGFFSPDMLKDQKGLVTTDEMIARREEGSPIGEMSLLDGGGDFAHLPGMANGKMRMFDKVTGFWPDAGDNKLGRIRTCQKLQPDSWYFKAHFYEDPVQPGSLGLEAITQSARALVHMKGWLRGIDNPVWEHPAVGLPLSWRYRGQVTPLNQEIVTEIEAKEVKIVPGESVTLQIYGTQWVDGLRIYEVPSFAVRVRSGKEPTSA